MVLQALSKTETLPWLGLLWLELAEAMSGLPFASKSPTAMSWGVLDGLVEAKADGAENLPRPFPKWTETVPGSEPSLNIKPVGLKARSTRESPLKSAATMKLAPGT